MSSVEKKLVESWQELNLGDWVTYFAEDLNSYIEAQVVGLPRRKESPIIILKSPFSKTRGSVSLSEVKVYH